MSNRIQSWLGKGKAVWQLGRPFTCLAPALGVLSGTLAALGAQAKRENVSVRMLLERLDTAGMFEVPERGWAMAVGFGVLSAIALNVYSNAINQVCDLDIDRMAKPERPLVTGALSKGAGISVALAALLASWTWALGARPPGSSGFASLQFMGCVMVASVLTTAYSVAPIRLKRIGVLANLAIALARGLLLKVAGWVCLFSALSPFDLEPWLIGGVFFLFVLGAVTTKDFSDAKADEACGVRSLPVAWGNKKAAWFAAIFLCLPWLLLPIFQWMGLLGASNIGMTLLGVVLFGYGGWTGWLLIRDPEKLGTERNHPAWTHMYLLMMVAQLGLAAAYLA